MSITAPSEAPADQSSCVEVHERFGDSDSASHFPDGSLQGRIIRTGHVHEESSAVPTAGEPITSLLGPNLLTHLFDFLEPADGARAALSCRAFRHARWQNDIAHALQFAQLFGVREIQFVGESPGGPCDIPSDELNRIVTRLEEINTGLPQPLQSRNSIREFALNPTWLRGFFRVAYEGEVIKAFSASAQVDTLAPVQTKLAAIRRWQMTASTITCLDFPRMNLSLLPKEIFNFANLNALHIFNNHLKVIPDEIGRLEALKCLGIVGNPQLAELPPQIGQLHALEFCCLKFNCLKTVPPQMGLLSQLKFLDLSHNKIRELPNEMKNLRSLVTLLVEFNDLTEIPEEVFRLPKIQRISVGGNRGLVVPAHLVAEFRARGGEFWQ